MNKNADFFAEEFTQCLGPSAWTILHTAEHNSESMFIKI